MKKLSIFVILGCLLALAFTACSGGGDPGGGNNTPVVGDYDISGNLAQTAGSVTAVTVTAKEGKSPGAVTVLYSGSATIPQAVGSYPVTFNVAAATGWNAASGLSAGTLEVNDNPTPVVGDYDISGNLTQTAGSVTAITVTAKGGKSPGVVTVLYNGSATIPQTVGSYPVTFNVAAATGWNAASGLTAGTLTVNKATPTVTTWPTAATITYGAALSTSELIGGVGEGTFAWTNSTTIPTVINSGYEVTFTPTDTANFNTLTQNVTITVLLGVEMVSVGAGSFQMGQNGNDSSGDTTPVHTVTLTQDYSLGKYEVTQKQWQAVMESLPSKLTSGSDHGRGDNYPVYYVSWYDVLVFCNKLSIAEGLTPAYQINNSTDPAVWGTVPDSSRDGTWDAVTIVDGSTGYRLPTEAQWEYAAKGGPLASNPYKIYSGSDTVDDVAWYRENSGDKTHEVGKKAANELGLYDMSGNIDEFCWDWYASYPSTDLQTDPTGASSGFFRVVRGGCFGYPIEWVSSAFRSNMDPYIRVHQNFGFRLVRPAQ